LENSGNCKLLSISFAFVMMIIIGQLLPRFHEKTKQKNNHKESITTETKHNLIPTGSFLFQTSTFITQKTVTWGGGFFSAIPKNEQSDAKKSH
jgi:hypothetical protein